ncbi:MAG: 16S rRNA (guanine(966)-N(2))-methyltransferase RsmD [Erysipelotrichaceae bacterium]|nr:16S rRNA (guanine(966)-N(2))-methyltransferase RsmD [Erysipelotrichaceae bacterium]MDD3810312.1 16S rRNA (guanine(966)-N(2))-methyltransferase RsmD [Erysipelotrichaceae bacterium]
MRVVAGKYRSRQLKTVKSNLTRPTTDKNKESMFNIIGPFFQGGVVLDLFAGSGGLGIEALSRGCDYLYSVDKQYGAFQVVRENLNSLKIENAQVFKMDYLKALQKFSEEKIKFDLVFLDPPYGRGLINGILEFLCAKDMLEDGAMIVVEELKEVTFDVPASLHLKKRHEYGITALTILEYGVVQ